jgi:hypothetical protein
VHRLEDERLRQLRDLARENGVEEAIGDLWHEYDSDERPAETRKPAPNQSAGSEHDFSEEDFFEDP